jgi:protein-tyrosine-phosphatase
MELERAGVTSVEVLSAGTVTVSGRPASEKAVTAMKEKGFDITGHRTTILDKKMAEEADLILTMTARHRREVIRVCPGAAGKVFTLGEFAGSGEDVVDPFGGSLEAYRRTAGQLAGLIRMAVDRLVKELRDGRV